MPRRMDRYGLVLQYAACAQQVEHLIRAFVERVRARLDDDLGFVRRLVRRRDAGKRLDLPRPRLLVESLHVALFAHLQRGLAVDLDEIAVHDQAAHALAVGTERRDEGGHRDHTGLDKQLGHLADAADILHAVHIRKPEIAAQAVADIIAVQHEGAAFQRMQFFFHRMRQGRFSGPGQPGEPQDGALVAVQGLAHLAVDGGMVPDDVTAFLFAAHHSLPNKIEDRVHKSVAVHEPAVLQHIMEQIPASIAHTRRRLLKSGSRAVRSHRR